MIQTKAECEQAALSLGLSDTTAFEGQKKGRPYGCIYASNFWLQWYSPVGSPHQSADCGTLESGNAYDCICKVGLGRDYFGVRVANFNYKGDIRSILLRSIIFYNEKTCCKNYI